MLSFACLPLPLLLSPHTHVGRFLIVIISGAIRAIRNPDRYGPRPGRRVDPQTGEENPYALPCQTRAEGLGKAILDTFPIVKFGRQQNAARLDSPGAPDDSDLLKSHSNSVVIDDENIMMRERDPVDSSGAVGSPNGRSSRKNEPDGMDSYGTQTSHIPLMSHTHPSSISSTYDTCHHSPPASKPHPLDSMLPDGLHMPSPVDEPLGRRDAGGTLITGEERGAEETSAVADTLAEVNNSMTCPICVCDFEDDDDIRMLPCDARHQFHKECVDPWLLNESKFCPLCRWDLSTWKDGTKITTELVKTQDELPSTPLSSQQFPTSSASPPEPTSSIHHSTGFLNDSRTEAGGRRTKASPSSRGASVPWLPCRSQLLPSFGDPSLSTPGAQPPDSQNQN